MEPAGNEGGISVYSRIAKDMASRRAVVITLALLGTSITSLASGECKLYQLAQLAVTVKHNRPLIDGEINGQKIKILVDTGAGYTMLWRSEAVRIGLPLRDVDGLRLFGVGGETKVQLAQLDEFKLAEFSTHGIAFLVAGEGRNDSFSAILGEDFLSKLTVEFDLAHGAIRLFRPVGCKPEQLMYWSPTYSAATLDSPPSHAHQINADVVLNGTRMIATLDTGATNSIVSPGAAASAGIRPPEASGGNISVGHGAGIGTHPFTFTVARFDSIAIGDEKIKNLELAVGDIGKYMQVDVTGWRLQQRLANAPHMLIGADFFLSHRLIVPSDSPIMLFTYTGGPVFQVIHDVAAASAGDSTGAGNEPAATDSKPDAGTSYLYRSEGPF